MDLDDFNPDETLIALRWPPSSGVDLEDYKSRFVVMNLLELSQEQQRNVIQMQLQGNLFFEHLVNIAECRKDLDSQYKEVFRADAVRDEIETIGVERENAAGAADGKEKNKGGAAGGDALKEKPTAGGAAAVEASNEGKGHATLKKKADDPKASTLAAAADDDQERSFARRGVAMDAPTRRRLALDNTADLQAHLAAIDMQEPLQSTYLSALNKAMLRPTKAYKSTLDQLDHEIRMVPIPCTRSQVRLPARSRDCQLDHEIASSITRLPARPRDSDCAHPVHEIAGEIAYEDL